jgi:hypothetical protein
VWETKKNCGKQKKSVKNLRETKIKFKNCGKKFFDFFLIKKVISGGSI